MYTTCIPSVHRDEKSVSDPLELELRVAVSHHLGAENETSLVQE